MDDDGVTRLQLEFTDFIGVSRCRLVTREVLARDGLPNFPWVNIAHDVSDGEPDPENMGPGSSTFWLNPDPVTYAPLPFVPGVASVQCTLLNADGSRYAGCARSLVADYAAVSNPKASRWPWHSSRKAPCSGRNRTAAGCTPATRRSSARPGSRS